MFGIRAWHCALFVMATLHLSCAKEADPGGEEPAADAAVASEAPTDPAARGPAQLPLGMDLEKGIPPWYVSGSGKIPTERVRQGVHEHSKSLVACNKAWDPGSGKHNAKIMFQFTIGEEGHIFGVTASESPGADEALVECVLAGMGEMTFDPPPVGGPVTYQMPLYFAKR